MIVRMKKLAVLLYHRQRDDFVKDLQGLGLVHIEEKSDSFSHDLIVFSNELKSYEQAIVSLTLHEKARGIKLLPKQQQGREPSEILAEFQKWDKEKTGLEQKISSLEKDQEILANWGDFDPQTISKLSETGIKTRFFTVPLKALNRLLEAVPGLTEVNRLKEHSLCVLFEKNKDSVVDAEETVLPQIRLSDCDKLVTEYKNQLEKILTQIDDLLVWKGMLVNQANLLSDSVAYETAKLSFSEEAKGKVLYLEGWIPANKEKLVNDKISEYRAVARFSDPKPNENVPVMMKNGLFSRLFEPILKIFSIPDYFELDPTPYFAPFFMLFVGLCLGDLAYGSIIFFLALAIVLFGPKKIRSMAGLGVVLGFSVMVSGVLLNSAFGATIFGGPGVSGASLLPTGADRFALLSSIKNDKGTFYPMMGISLFIGYLQIHVALILNAINKIRLGNPGGALRPVADILLITGSIAIATHTNAFNLQISVFTPFGIPIGQIPLLIPFPVTQAMFFLGLLLFIVFDEWGQPFFKKFGWSLFNLYLFISGALGNLLSYMRLFALGLSSSMLAMVFNSLAFGFITVDGVVNPASPMIMATIVLLVVGHSINFGLAILGSFVHPMRLTFLEFFSTLGFKGNGRAFKPLVKATK